VPRGHRNAAMAELLARGKQSVLRIANVTIGEYLEAVVARSSVLL
jgi:hypothetical protein